MKSLSAGPVGTVRVAVPRHSTLHGALLVSGILAALLYAAMNVCVPLLDENYNSATQTISELSAIGAPTRPIWAGLGVLYTLLIIAFGSGILASAGKRRSLRIAGGLLVVFGIVGLFWPPMHQRGIETTLTDALHIAWTAMWGLATMIAMGFSAAAFGKTFRWYTIATIAVQLGAGVMTSLQSPNIPKNLPTPTIGIWERVVVVAFLFWILSFAALLLREARTSGAGARSREIEIHGFVAPGFEAVQDAFADNFRFRNELGGACSIYHRGEKVVDLWGGIRDEATGAPWEEDTKTIVFSTTKGLAAMTLAMAHSRGWLDYDERVAAYWPDFAQNGKGRMTVRQLLAHHGGLFAFNEPVDRNLLEDLDRLAIVLARQKPEWEPGARQAYHAISLGFYEGELLRRIDPRHRSLGQFFQDEIATPLELDFYIRLPESVPNPKLAVLDKGNPFKALLHMSPALLLAGFNPRSAIFRALMVNPGSWISLDEQTVYARHLEVPSGGGVGTARAIARAYSAFATGGKELGLTKQTLDLLSAPAVPSAHGFYDEALKGEVEFSLGFMKTCQNWRFGHEGAFGAPGAGGSLGYADPQIGLAYGYVTNRMGRSDGDPRDVALRNAIPENLPEIRPPESKMAHA